MYDSRKDEQSMDWIIIEWREKDGQEKQIIALNYMAQLRNNIYILIIRWKVNTNGTQNDDLINQEMEEIDGGCVCVSGEPT